MGSTGGKACYCGVVVRVVGTDGSAAHELHELDNGLRLLGSALVVAVADAGELGDFVGYALAGVNEGLEAVKLLAVLDDDRADFGNAVVLLFVYLINLDISETTSSKVRVVFA